MLLTPTTTPTTPVGDPRHVRAESVRLSGVSRSFATATGTHHVLHDVDLRVGAGEITALIGASGCGKSTLLREICGLDQPSSGTIVIGGHPVRPADTRCAVAFQEPRLLPWRSVRDNVRLGLPRATDKTAGTRRVDRLLDLVGLTDAADRRPREISGGMAQRVSLARALARNPAVLLLDEPFGALDALTRLRMQDLLLDIHAAEPTTVVLVTHDVEEALYLADRVALIGSAAPGRGSAVRTLITVPGDRPRARGDAAMAALRADLLDGLGVPTHH